MSQRFVVVVVKSKSWVGIATNRPKFLPPQSVSTPFYYNPNLCRMPHKQHPIGYLPEPRQQHNKGGQQGELLQRGVAFLARREFEQKGKR